MWKNKIFFCLIVLLLLLGTFGLGTWFGLYECSIISGRDTELRSNSGRYTNPLLECDFAQGIINDPQRKNFERALREFTLAAKEAEHVTDVGVYFRDLNNGPVFGVGEEKKFIPASVLKVPVMMAFYKSAETNPSILSAHVTLSDETHLPESLQNNTPAEQLVVGRTYTIDELVTHMIRYSDNQALELLASQLPSEALRTLYEKIGIDPRAINDPSVTVSVKEVSAFFRILFNASYLSQADSEKALSLLTQTVFVDGLRKGVPPSIPVAHKFGVRPLQDGTIQLSDCGIVYYPRHPYLLCIMTRGTNRATLARLIADVSGYVFRTVSEEYE